MEQCGACQCLTGFVLLHVVFRSGAKWSIGFTLDTNSSQSDTHQVKSLGITLVDKHDGVIRAEGSN